VSLDDLAKRDFLRAIVARDVSTGRYGGRVVTRFPPEPNGYLHLGHAKAIVVDFGIARDFGGICYLRMDDTNPTTESMEFAENIAADVRWLGFDYGDRLTFASDVFEAMYRLAERLIEKGLAYVDECSEDEIRQLRGTVTEPGRPGPWRDRPAAESLERFRQMRAGAFPNGAMVLRGRIDLSATNMLLRDPILYRIKHAHHFRTGDDWCIYPMYDYAHCLEDALEGVTHSICTLEFDNNRALYDWVIQATEVVPPELAPQQYEMARLEVEYIVTSKRRLKQLVDEGHVRGWDDPRMPTLAGLRRRGIPPQALVAFIERVGIAKTNSRVEYSLLEHAIRDHLNLRARRLMGVADPLRVVVENWGADEVDELGPVPWLAEDPSLGGRSLRFGKELFIAREDFELSPPPGFKRLVPGGEVRLLHGYAIRHLGHELDGQGRVRLLRVEVDRSTRGGDTGRRMGSIQWVEAQGAVPATLRLYDQLLLSPTPMADPSGRDFLDLINPDSLVEQAGLLEPAAASLPVGQAFQVMRTGYFAADPDSRPGALVLNRTIPLKDGFVRKEEAPPVDPVAVVGEDERRKRKKRPAAELRAEARSADPRLAAAQDELLAAGLDPAEADVLSGDHEQLALLRAIAAACGDLPGSARFLTNELRGRDVQPAALMDKAPSLGALLTLRGAGTLTGPGASRVLDVLLAEGGQPAEIAQRLGLSSLSDGALRAEVQAVLDRHPDELSRLRQGEQKLRGFFMGQVMKATRGRAEPQLAQAVLDELLNP